MIDYERISKGIHDLAVGKPTTEIRIGKRVRCPAFNEINQVAHAHGRIAIKHFYHHTTDMLVGFPVADAPVSDEVPALVAPLRSHGAGNPACWS